MKADADGFVTQYGYDPRNLVETINYSGGKSAQFCYNKNGELVKMTDWNGTTGFALDQLGRITSVNDHNNNLTGYDYDTVGNKTEMVYPDNSVVNYTYNKYAGGGIVFIPPPCFPNADNGYCGIRIEIVSATVAQSSGGYSSLFIP